MEKVVPWWIRQVPNTLSGVRFGLAVAFPLLPDDKRLPAVVASGATDWLDGLIARRYGVQSTFGGLFDAVADKAFVLAALLTLAARGLVAWWQVPLVLARDAAVLATALYFAARREWAAFGGMPARWSGKVTTLLVFAWFVALLLPAPGWVVTTLFVLLAAASTSAGMDYLVRFGHALAGRTER